MSRTTVKQLEELVLSQQAVIDQLSSQVAQLQSQVGRLWRVQFTYADGRVAESHSRYATRDEAVQMVRSSAAKLKAAGITACRALN